MPTYNYKCPECKSYTHAIHGMNDGILIECDTCEINGKISFMEKQVSKPAVHFKGSGFYETDYKGK